MTKKEFKRRWELDDSGDGLTYQDIAICAKEWGLFERPMIHSMDLVRKRVLEFAGIEEESDEEESDPCCGGDCIHGCEAYDNDRDNDSFFMNIRELPSQTTLKIVRGKGDKKDKLVCIIKNGDITVSSPSINIGMKKFMNLYMNKKYKSVHRRKDLLGKVCSICGETEEITTDHKIPIAFFKLFGNKQDAEFPENYDTYCKSCNYAKGSLVDLSNEEIYKSVINYIKKCRAYSDPDKILEQL